MYCPKGFIIKMFEKKGLLFNGSKTGLHKIVLATPSVIDSGEFHFPYEYIRCFEVENEKVSAIA
jgi:hypothetical protein